jgi:hypothetical protein
MKKLFALFVCGLEASCIFLMDELSLNSLNFNSLSGLDAALSTEDPPFAEIQTFFNVPATSTMMLYQISVPLENGLKGA